MKDKKDEKSKNFFDPFNSREEDVIVFVDPKKKEEWVNLDENVKKLTLSRLTECVKKVSNDMALDLLSHAINELAARIKKLEEDKMEKEK